MKKIFFCTITLLCMSATTTVSFAASADSAADKASVRVALVGSVEWQSRYVWRGLALGGNAPTLEPGAALHYKGLSLNVWGAYSLNDGAYQELDWTLAYTLLDKALTLQVTDYTNPRLDGNYHYFDFAAHTTPHVLEAGVLLGIPKTNLKVSAFVNFFGNDARTATGNLCYSSYVELSYATCLKCLKADLSFAAGAALNGKENYSFYGNDGMQVVNVSAEMRRKLQLSSALALPVYLRLVANPCANKLHCLLGTIVEF